MERLESLTTAGNCVDQIGFRVCPLSPVSRGVAGVWLTVSGVAILSNGWLTPLTLRGGYG